MKLTTECILLLRAIAYAAERSDEIEAQSAFRVIGQVPAEEYLLPNREAHVRPLDVSDTMYTCPKEGYTLVDDECVYETRIESRFDCPPGYTFNGVLCETFQPVQWRCQGNGSFINGKCQHLEVYDTNLACPAGSSLSSEGLCISLEAVTYIDVCPANTIRSPAGCLAVEYHEPVYVCPADFYLDGKKCRREVLTYKYKKTAARLLSESAESATEDEIEAIELDDAGDVLEDMVEQMQGETDIVQYMANPSQEAPLRSPEEFAYYVVPQPENEMPARWLPAEAQGRPLGEPLRAPSDYLEPLQWEKIPVGYPFPEASVGSSAPPYIIARGAKNPVRKNVQPQQMVKVISQAAEKICPVGSRYGGACVSETVTAPIKECPLPLIEGVCAKRVAIAPVVTCSYNASLNCVGRTCRCEILRESLPFPSCRNPGFELYSEDQCVHQLIPRRLCPLGFFLDAEDLTICARRDVEPALTLFSVTYACADCFEYPGVTNASAPILKKSRRISQPAPVLPIDTRLPIDPRLERKQRRNGFDLLGAAEAGNAVV